MKNILDKELTNCEDTLRQSQEDVGTLSSLVYEFTEPGSKGCLDAEEHLYLGKKLIRYHLTILSIADFVILKEFNVEKLKTKGYIVR